MDFNITHFTNLKGASSGKAIDGRRAMASGVLDLSERLIDENDQLRVLPAAELQAIDPHALRLWGGAHGIYLFPTTELVAWLAERIAGVKAVEIGAGNGALGRALGIPVTDSRWQEEPQNQVWLSGNPPVIYGKDVEKLEARDAVYKHKAHTAIGAWVTGKGTAGNKWVWPKGVDEMALLKRVKRYIVIGNEEQHAGKVIKSLPHEVIEVPWLVSRSSFPEKDRIYVWEGR